MNTKRLFSLLLALLLVTLSAAAVADGMTMEEAYELINNGGLTKYDTAGKAALDEACYASLPLSDGEKLTVMAPHSVSNGDFNTCWFVDSIEARTGIDLEISEIESSVWDEKVNIAFASGEYPDIFLSGLESKVANKYGQQGLLVDISELIPTYAPIVDYCLNLGENTRRSITAVDGAIFYVPNLNLTLTGTVDYKAYINMDYLKNLGLEKPTTIDEFYDILVAVRDGDADGDGDPTNEIPMIMSYDDSFQFDGIIGAFGFVDPMYDVIDGKFVYVHAEDNYRAYVEFMAKLYQEGLLNEDYFTINDSERNAKLAQGNTFYLYKNFNPTNYFEDYEKYDLITPMTSDYCGTPTWRGKTTGGNTCFAVTDNCENVELAVKLLNYLFTDENCMNYRWGPEVGTIEATPDSGWSYDETTDRYSTFGDGDVKWSNWKKLHVLTVPDCQGTGITNDINTKTTDENLWVNAKIISSGLVDVSRVGLPDLQYTDEENEIITPVYTDCYLYVMAEVAKFISGEKELNDANWEAYVAEMNRLGLAEMIEAQQAAYDRWLNG